MKEGISRLHLSNMQFLSEDLKDLASKEEDTFDRCQMKNIANDMSALMNSLHFLIVKKEKQNSESNFNKS